MANQIQFLAVAATLLGAAGVARSQTITFNEHIAPIIYSNCSKCHHTGEVAPFPLMSYSDVVQHATTIAIVTQSHYMPPWKPEPGWTTYKDERRLTPDQISLIGKWVEQGMQQGDPAKAPPAPVFADGWLLGTPDLILEMPKAFPVPADGPDIYRNFVIHTSQATDKWIKAIELKPSARAVVHHSLFFTDTTGAAQSQEGIDGLPGFPGFSSIFTLNLSNSISGGLGGWVPGTTPELLPDGIATSLPKGADFLLQTHFHPNGTPQSEKTVIGLYFGPAPTRPMTQIQTPAFFGIQAHIDILPGVSDYKVRGSFTLPVDVDAVGVWAHTHYLGKEAKLTATLPTGEVRILLWIKNWDFNWQDQYLFQNLIPLPQGTRLDGELMYDNSVNNLINPSSPPKEVVWGENTTDEMGSLLLNVVPKNVSDLSALQGTTLAFMLTPVQVVGKNPLITSSGITDAASKQNGAVTPGKIIVLSGDRLGATQPSQAVVTDGRLPTSLGGTQILFDNVPAPLLYTSTGQVGAIAPYELDGKTGTQVQIINGSTKSGLIALPVKPAAPSIFSVDLSGTGPAAILNQDNITVNSDAHPAEKGSVISIYATGEGQTTPPGIDGLVAGSTLPKPALDVQVLIDGHPATVMYAGAAPGSVAGLFQVNVRIPSEASSGDVPIEIHVGTAVSQAGMTVAVK